MSSSNDSTEDMEQTITGHAKQPEPTISCYTKLLFSVSHPLASNAVSVEDTEPSARNRRSEIFGFSFVL